MGISVEYNDVLALRESGDTERTERETIPVNIQEGVVYTYQKDGYRIFPIGKVIPLVVTQGRQQFTRVAALVVIGRVSVDLDPCDSQSVSCGWYRVIKVLDLAQSNQWLGFLQNPLNIKATEFRDKGVD